MILILHCALNFGFFVSQEEMKRNSEASHYTNSYFCPFNLQPALDLVSSLKSRDSLAQKQES